MTPTCTRGPFPDQRELTKIGEAIGVCRNGLGLGQQRDIRAETSGELAGNGDI